MRLAYLVDGLRPGGKERQTVELLRSLARREGMSVLLVSLGQEDFFESALRSAGVQVARLPRHMRWDPTLFFRLYKLLKRFRAELVHTTCWMTSFYGLPVARCMGARVVNGSIRNAFAQPSLRWRLERLLLRLSDVRLANSMAGLASRGFRLDGPGNHVVRNGFDFHRLKDLDHAVANRLADETGGRKVVGMVAQFKDDKDYATYFEAARRILDQRQDVIFVAIGDGKNFEAYRRSLAHCPQIRLLGRQAAVESFVSRFDVGVLATFTEGISNAVMEYMALGKPCIVTNGGGSCELVEHGVTGFLVPPGDPAALAGRIFYCLDHPARASELGRAGHERLVQFFSLQGLVTRTLDVYRLALDLPRRAGRSSGARVAPGASETSHSLNPDFTTSRS